MAIRRFGDWLLSLLSTRLMTKNTRRKLWMDSAYHHFQLGSIAVDPELTPDELHALWQRYYAWYCQEHAADAFGRWLARRTVHEGRWKIVTETGTSRPCSCRRSERP
jgi:hypothetical protein